MSRRRRARDSYGRGGYRVIAGTDPPGVPTVARLRTAEPHGLRVRSADSSRMHRVDGISRMGRASPLGHVDAVVPFGEGIHVRKGPSRLRHSGGPNTASWG